MAAVLRALPNVDGVNVTKENCANPEKKCKWAVTFSRVLFQAEFEMSEEEYTSGEPFFPNLVPDVRELKGNNASIAVTEVTRGRPPLHISGSPFFVHVATNDTHPATTTAFGRGLYAGTTGEVSSFTVQSKDDFGNDRTDDLARDDFLVVPFIADTSYDTFEGFHPPTVVSSYTGHGSYGFHFTPVISGDYTVAVLVAMDREHQRVVTSFPAASTQRREGTWTLRLHQVRTRCGCGTDGHTMNMNHREACKALLIFLKYTF